MFLSLKFSFDGLNSTVEVQNALEEWLHGTMRIFCSYLRGDFTILGEELTYDPLMNDEQRMAALNDLHADKDIYEQEEVLDKEMDKYQECMIHMGESLDKPAGTFYRITPEGFEVLFEVEDDIFFAIPDAEINKPCFASEFKDYYTKNEDKIQADYDLFQDHTFHLTEIVFPPIVEKYLFTPVPA